MTTIVYSKGGETWLGSREDRPLRMWKMFGQARNQRYMYKGFRYSSDGKDIIVVYDNIRWSAK